MKKFFIQDFIKNMIIFIDILKKPFYAYGSWKARSRLQKLKFLAATIRYKMNFTETNPASLYEFRNGLLAIPQVTEHSGEPE